MTMYVDVEIEAARDTVIGTIKFIRNATGWGLKESKDFYESLVFAVGNGTRKYSHVRMTMAQYGRFIAHLTLDGGTAVDIRTIRPIRIGGTDIDIRDIRRFA